MYPACPFLLKSNMAQTKVYRTKHSYLSMFVTVNKRPLRITFSGGDMTSGGVFTTPDKAVQKAVEQSSRYLTGEISQIAVYGEPEVEEVKAPENTTPINPEPVSTSPAPKGTKVYPVEINTVQKAGRALMQDFGALAKEVETKAKLIVKAQELNVEFPGLPQ